MSDYRETAGNPEKDLENLRMTLLDMINQHNSDPTHRRVAPIDNFGKFSGGMALFLANWSDDIRSSHLVGFMYLDNKLVRVGHHENISFEEAVSSLSEELRNIPAK